MMHIIRALTKALERICKILYFIYFLGILTISNTHLCILTGHSHINLLAIYIGTICQYNEGVNIPYTLIRMIFMIFRYPQNSDTILVEFRYSILVEFRYEWVRIVPDSP